MVTEGNTLLKANQESDEKLKKAVELEQSAVKIQKDAAQLRDESESNLVKTRIERANTDKLQAERVAENERKENELKNREVKLSASQALLARNKVDYNKDLDDQGAVLDARTAAADKAELRNKDFGETLDERAAKYNSIAEFIKKIL